MPDAIDWSTLHHAYGSAEDVPRILRAIASSNPGEREGGFHDFYGSLCHQGTVYSASLAAIPFLIETLASPSYPARAALLGALGALARGCGEGVEMRDVHAELARGEGLLLDIAQKGTPEEAERALSIFGGPAFEGAASAIADVARCATSPRVRARAWEALLAVAPGSLPEPSDADPAVALVATLCRLDASPSDASAVAAVARALDDRAAVAQAVAWARATDSASPFAHLAAHLKADDPELLPRVTQEFVFSYETEDATRLAHLLLDASFPERADGDERVDLAHLSPKQRAVLAALVDSESVWTIEGSLNGNLLYWLGRRGLPSGSDARKELLSTLGVELRKRVAIVTPRQVRGAREVVMSIGREAWLDVPFVFLRGSEGLDEEDEEDEGAAPASVVVPPCHAFSELSDEQKKRLAAFVACLDAAGFSEATASYGATQTMGSAGIHSRSCDRGYDAPDRRAALGMNAGKVWIAEDFDTPTASKD